LNALTWGLGGGQTEKDVGSPKTKSEKKGGKDSRSHHRREREKTKGHEKEVRRGTEREGIPRQVGGSKRNFQDKVGPQKGSPQRGL